MIPDVDIFVGNYTVIDLEVFELWVQGYSVAESVSILLQRGALESWGASIDLLTSDTCDHYRLFSMLEKALLNPLKLDEEWMFQIDPPTQKLLVQKYYELDDVVVREILGKKLSSRTRKDLDDVAEKTAILLRSCRRQFDNVKRIFKHVEEATAPVVQSIQRTFLLPVDLVRKYAAIVFLLDNRFETGKRKLNYLAFNDFSGCAFAMMDSWTGGVTGNSGGGGAGEGALGELELDRDFLRNLRDLKVLVEREKEHRNVTLSHVRGQIPDRMCTEVESNFKVYSRALVNIACGLNNTRDLRDFFVDVAEKVVDQCRQSRWRTSDLKVFLHEYTQAGAGLDLMSSDLQLRATWERYMTVMELCICQLYHP